MLILFQYHLSNSLTLFRLLDNTGKLRLDRDSLSHVNVDMDSAARAWLAEHPDALRELMASEATTRDVVAVAYRRKQLEAFERLLNDEQHFDQLADRFFNGRKEATWQSSLRKIDGSSATVSSTYPPMVSATKSWNKSSQAQR